jgi:hypothetical protein
MRAACAAHIEPALAEILDEPIVVMLMLRDGVERQDVEQLCRSIAERRLPTHSAGSAGAQAQMKGSPRFTAAV